MTAAAHPVLPQPRGLPDPAQVQVWLDFDGTITQRDVLDELIARFALNDSWKLIEERWQSGLIGSKQCLEEEFALLRLDQRELSAFLDEMVIDRGLLPLLELLARMQVPCAILSDGVDRFIRPILRRAGVGETELQIRSNTIVHQSQSLALRCPHYRAECESAAAHCKCESMKILGAADRRSIYVGDGRSDLCPARKASVVFAKNVLAKSLADEGIPFIRYYSLSDVAGVLSAAWMSR